MAAAGSSMLYSFLLFVATLSLQEMYRAKLASSELFTILGGFTSSLIFLLFLTDVLTILSRNVNMSYHRDGVGTFYGKLSGNKRYQDGMGHRYNR